AEGTKQPPQVATVMFPASDRLRRNRLAHLDGARRAHNAARVEKGQTALVPIQTAESEQTSGDLLLAMNQRFIRDFMDLRGQNARPMRHDFLVGAVVGPDIVQRPGKNDLLKILEITGQANIEGITPAMNDARSREQRSDEAQEREVSQSLDRDPGGSPSEER